MAKKYDHVIGFVASEPWAILPETLDVITDILRMRASGLTLTAEEIQTRIGTPKPKAATQGAIAVMPLFGVITHRASMLTDSSGGTSTERFAGKFRALVNDPGVYAIVLDVDSPGGRTAGLQELHAEIMAARGVKKVVAVANSMMASAAYWIASAADEIVITPSGFAGSIGVVALHISEARALEEAGIDVEVIQAGKYKTEGNPYQPLGDEARARIQQTADRIYGEFVKAVAAGRGVSVGAVKDEYGQGRVLDAKEAKEAGLVDQIGTLDETIARLETPRGRAMKRAPEMAAVNVTFTEPTTFALNLSDEQEDRENERPDEPKGISRERVEHEHKKRSAPRA